MRHTLTAAAVGLWAALGMSSGAAAQNLFSPVVTVNEAAITGYELDQRIRLLEAFRTPGDLPRVAREQLIEDRLKAQELARAGLKLTDAALLRAMEEFAGRANMPLDQFLAMLAQAGVAEQTLRDYVEIGITWRDYVRQRYNRTITITEADIDAAIARDATATSRVEVLLSEIIIPAPPPEAERALARAREIARTTSTAVFEAAARELSALPSRDNGGRLDWLPVADLPAGLAPILLRLAPGQVTAPIPIENGVALFQLRAVREVGPPRPQYAAIDYAVYYIDGGLSAPAQAEAARIAAVTDSCDDLYGLAFGQPPERLERHSLPPAEIPQDIAMELAKLDPGEVSATLTRNGGATLMLLMLCGRTPATAEPVDRDAVRNRLRGERLAAYSDALVADLRAAATIVGE